MPNFFKKLFNNEKRNACITQDYYNLGLKFGSNYSDNNCTTLSSFYSCLELISNSIAELPIYVMKDNSILDTHPIYDAFDNSLLSKFTIMKKLVWDMYMNGNGFLYIDRNIDGSVKKFTYLRPSQVTVSYNENSHDLYYIANTVAIGKIEPVNMIHLIKDSLDGVNGTSISVYANQSIILNHYINDAASEWFSKGMNISGILNSTGPVSEKQKQEIRNSWEQTHGNGKSGLAVLSANFKYEQIGSNAQESQMLESREFSISEIARFFNMSPSLIGNNSSKSYNQVEQETLQFVSHTLMPVIKLIENEFNRKMILPSEKKLLSINIDESFLIKSDKQTEANYYKTLVSGGLMTVNEARIKLGLPTKDGGDDLIMPFTNISQNKVNGSNNQGDNVHDLNNNNMDDNEPK